MPSDGADQPPASLFPRQDGGRRRRCAQFCGEFILIADVIQEVVLPGLRSGQRHAVQQLADLLGGQAAALGNALHDVVVHRIEDRLQHLSVRAGHLGAAPNVRRDLVFGNRLKVGPDTGQGQSVLEKDRFDQRPAARKTALSGARTWSQAVAK